MAVVGEISQITLPSGNTYELKDAAARASINGIFTIAWNGNATPTVANVPKDVSIVYNSTTYTGALTATADTLGKIYLVKSSSQQNPTLLDIYDEYVTVALGTTPETYTWEKIGDTQIKLTEIVTNVTLNKQTSSVIGSNATLKVTTQPAYSVTPKTTYIAASASGGAVSASGDSVTAVTGYASPQSDTFLKSVSANTSKLKTTTITGVSGSTTASKVSADTSQTTVSGFTTDTTTDAFLKGWSVSGETLTINGAAASTQTTTQINIDTPSVTVPIAASSATRVATGALDANDANGSTIATGIKTPTNSDKATALTGLGTPSTDTVLGTASTFSVTNPTISLSAETSTGTGRVAVASTAAATVSQTTNAAIGWNSKDTQTVLNNSTDITVTHPN